MVVGVFRWESNGWGGGDCPNYWLTRGRVVGAFHLYLSVCMSGLFDGVKISAKFSIQVNQ